MRLGDSPKRVYWDSCAWIGFINSEADKIRPLRSIWEDAERGKYVIWTSVYAYIEVIKGIAAHGDPYPPAESDSVIYRTLSQNWVKRAQVDIQVAKMARDLKRKFHKDGLKKRPDAIHPPFITTRKNFILTTVTIFFT
jgi:PIN domain nuclease of toxin-antitoxin system